MTHWIASEVLTYTTTITPHCHLVNLYSESTHNQPICTLVENPTAGPLVLYSSSIKVCDSEVNSVCSIVVVIVVVDSRVVVSDPTAVHCVNCRDRILAVDTVVQSNPRY